MHWLASVALFRVNVDVYKTLVQQMAAVLEEKLAADAEAASAGLVVNSMGWVEGSGYQVLEAARGRPLSLSRTGEPDPAACRVGSCWSSLPLPLPCPGRS